MSGTTDLAGNIGKQQAALAELGLFALEDHDLSTLMDKATELVASCLEVEFCKVLELRPDDRLLLRTGHGFRSELIGKATISAGSDTQAGYTLLVQEPVVVGNLPQEARFSGPRLLHDHGIISGITVVINTTAGPYGVLGAHSRLSRAFDTADVYFLQSVANVLGEGVRRRRNEQALSESEQRFRTIFETAPVGVAEIDLAGAYCEVNGRLCQQLGYSREELLQLGFRDIVAPDYLVERDRQSDRLLRGEIDIHQADIPYLRKGGEVFWGQLTLSLVRSSDGKPRHFIAVIENIDARKQAERALEEQTARLQRANRELELFNFSVSHDLRTPLRGIDGFSQLLMEEYAGSLDQTGQNYLQRVRAGARRLGGLLDGLLALSQVEQSELREQRVDLSGMAAGIIDELAALEPERQVDARIEPGVVVLGDERLLALALENLLDNAWRFTRDRDMATIMFGVEQQDGRQVYFVRDNGIGFDMRFADKLFMAFQRLHSSDAVEAGEHTGTGLATVQRVIRRHGGEVWAHGRPDEGATFYFTL